MIPPRALLHRAQWATLGVHGRRLASSEFLRVFPGYYTPSDQPATLNAMCHVLQHRILCGTTISHSTAAVLLGIALPHDIDRGVGLLPDMNDTVIRHGGLALVPSVRTDGSDPSVPARVRLPGLHVRSANLSTTSRVGGGADRGVTVHRLRPGPSVVRAGLVLSDPLEVLRELATHLAHEDLVVAVDSLIGPGVGPGVGKDPPTLDRVRLFLATISGRSGAKGLRRAVASAREGVESPGETRTRLLVTAAGFPEPTPNVAVKAAGRRRRIDNAYRDLRIGLEYDGDIHRRDRQRWREDEARRDELAAAGWELRRLTGEDITRPLSFLLRLRETFLRHGIPAPGEDHLRKFVGERDRARRGRG